MKKLNRNGTVSKLDNVSRLGEITSLGNVTMNQEPSEPGLCVETSCFEVCHTKVDYSLLEL